MLGGLDQKKGIELARIKLSYQGIVLALERVVSQGQEAGQESSP